jgi:hypothetical protein
MKLKEWGYLRHNTQRRSTQSQKSREQSTTVEENEGENDNDSDETTTAVGNMSAAGSERKYSYPSCERRNPLTLIQFATCNRHLVGRQEPNQ